VNDSRIVIAITNIAIITAKNAIRSSPTSAWATLPSHE